MLYDPKLIPKRISLIQWGMRHQKGVILGMILSRIDLRCFYIEIAVGGLAKTLLLLR